MAVRASREIVIDAPPEAILDAIADIEAAPTWSSVHKHVHVVDRYPDGRPRRVKVT
ncbi:MAG: SRPBCC family protein, partial [Mycolicibacterium aromaticivorans]|nr:SRPBCC family protein [Mycolicibacterium aromaticivorans]